MIRPASLKRLAISTGFYGPARFLQRHVFARQRLEQFRADLEFYGRLVQPGALCFDVGANIGDKSEILLRLGARVVAFEPQPDCIRELRIRCKRFPQLTTISAAVGSTSAVATLYTRQFSGQSSLLPNWEGQVVGSYDVPVVTLDAAIARYGVPDYCKIDVEGWELEVLRGLSCPIPLVSFEYHLESGDLAKARACLDRLSELGRATVNIAAAEGAQLRFSSWMPLDEFREWFPAGVVGESHARYGDIFVRMSRR